MKTHILVLVSSTNCIKQVYRVIEQNLNRYVVVTVSLKGFNSLTFHAKFK